MTVTTQTYRVPSAAMLPTLRTGEHVSILLDTDYKPRVGDLVVFHPPSGADALTQICGNPNQGAGHPAACSVPTPERSSQRFIKRIVAAPGETLLIRNGGIVRNGVPDEEPYVLPLPPHAPHVDYPTPITIPPDHYFMLGDNRAASSDSRFWGPVPSSWIIGKVRTHEATASGQSRQLAP